MLTWANKKVERYTEHFRATWTMDLFLGSQVSGICPEGWALVQILAIFVEQSAPQGPCGSPYRWGALCRMDKPGKASSPLINRLQYNPNKSYFCSMWGPKQWRGPASYVSSIDL